MPNFMDKIRGAVDRGVVSVGAKSKELMEIAQIQSSIKRLEQERNVRLHRLGESIYRMLVNGGDPDVEALKPLVGSVRGLDERIAKARARIVHLQEDTQRTIEAARAFTEEPLAGCPCGSPLRETSRYCPRCGRDVSQIVADAQRTHATSPPPRPSTTCSRCGRPLPAGVRFCAACGASSRSRATPPPPHASA